MNPGGEKRNKRLSRLNSFKTDFKSVVIKWWYFAVAVSGARAQEGTSVKPPCVVPILNQPVCGSDGKTYENEYAVSCAAETNPGKPYKILVGALADQ